MSDTGTSIQNYLNSLSSLPGSILYRDQLWWKALPPGNAGEILSLSSALLPYWRFFPYYAPAFMQFNGTNAYYTKLNYTVSGNVTTGIVRFARSSFTGGGIETLIREVGNASRERLTFHLYASDYATTSRRGKLEVRTQNSAGTNIARLWTAASVCDGAEHIGFYAFNGNAGTAVFVLDGLPASDTTNPEYVAPTTGTLDSGNASDFSVGATAGGSNRTGSRIGFAGIRPAYLTNYTDFMNGKYPLQLNQSTWWQWGAQPDFFHEAAKMDQNAGSKGAMTVNGTITLAQTVALT